MRPPSISAHDSSQVEKYFGGSTLFAGVDNFSFAARVYLSDIASVASVWGASAPLFFTSAGSRQRLESVSDLLPEPFLTSDYSVPHHLPTTGSITLRRTDSRRNSISSSPGTSSAP